MERDDLGLVCLACFLEINEGLTGSGDAGVSFITVVEIREQLIVFLLGELIVFMIMAAGAADRESEPNRAQSFHTIHDGGYTPLFLIRSAFCVGESLSIEGGSQFMQGGCFW